MATYTTLSTASNDGTAVHAHPDVGAGLGIGVYQTAGYASMAALQTALVGSAWTEIGPEHSADVVCNSSGDTFLISWYRSFPLQRLFAHYCVTERESGKLRWISKNSARAETTEAALQSVGLKITGLIDSATLADTITNNGTLKAAGIPLVILRA